MRPGRLMSASHHSTPLVVRASLPRTFLGLGIFAEGSLIFAGVYLLANALKRPLEAEQSSVIGAGVLLSLATVLLFYLVWPNRHEALAREDDFGTEELQMKSPLTPYGDTVQTHLRAKQALADIHRLPGPM